MNRVPIVSLDLKFGKVDGAWCKYSGVAKDVSAFDGNEEWLLQSFYRVSCAVSTELRPVVSSAWSVRLLEHTYLYCVCACDCGARSFCVTLRKLVWRMLQNEWRRQRSASGRESVLRSTTARPEARPSQPGASSVLQQVAAAVIGQRERVDAKEQDNAARGSIVSRRRRILFLNLPRSPKLALPKK